MTTHIYHACSFRNKISTTMSSRMMQTRMLPAMMANRVHRKRSCPGGGSSSSKTLWRGLKLKSYTVTSVSTNTRLYLSLTTSTLRKNINIVTKHNEGMRFEPPKKMFSLNEHAKITHNVGQNTVKRVNAVMTIRDVTRA